MCVCARTCVNTHTHVDVFSAALITSWSYRHMCAHTQLVTWVLRSKLRGTYLQLNQLSSSQRPAFTHSTVWPDQIPPMATSTLVSPCPRPSLSRDWWELWGSLLCSGRWLTFELFSAQWQRKNQKGRCSNQTRQRVTQSCSCKNKSPVLTWDEVSVSPVIG